MEIINEILELPVIVQGALGSALFAFIAWLLKILFNHVNVAFSKFNKQFRDEAKTAELVGLYYEQSGRGSDSTIFLTWCIYYALVHLTQAAIWLVLGSVLGGFISTFTYVGYLGALYYLFRARKMLPKGNNDFSSEELDAKILKLEQELGE
ncbi:hypothetical protein ACGDLY_012170 [Vibrio campbellii]